MKADLNALSAFAVEYRYPGESADLDEAREALEKMPEGAPSHSAYNAFG